MELLHVGEEPDQHEVQGPVRRVGEGEQPAGRREARDQRSDGSDLRRHPHVEAGRREGEEHRRRQGARRDDRPDGGRTVGLHARDGRQPSPAQAGDDWRDPRRRAVQRRVEDQDGRACAAVEPVHRWQPGQAGRRQLDSGVPAPAARGAGLMPCGTSRFVCDVPHARPPAADAPAALAVTHRPRRRHAAPLPFPTPDRIPRCLHAFAEPPARSWHAPPSRACCRTPRSR
ncbi:hypothetical protein BCEN4_1320021 [Burkholderia cenocepacia]|nr:hypothetical protein BCEN4_1320021 [Burkholderia cenocepacia]